VLATTRKLIEQISAQPPERALPGTISATMALPSTPFWDANTERLHLLPVDVTVPLLRFHALYEDATRKLAVASAVPSGTLASTLNALAEIGKAAVVAIEASLGIERGPEPEPKPKAAPPPPPEKPSTEKASSELNNPPRTATN